MRACQITFGVTVAAVGLVALGLSAVGCDAAPPDDRGSTAGSNPSSGASSTPAAPTNSEMTGTVSVGDQAPVGTVFAQDGSAYELEQAFNGQNAALVFYRGDW